MNWICERWILQMTQTYFRSLKHWQVCVLRCENFNRPAELLNMNGVDANLAAPGAMKIPAPTAPLMICLPGPNDDLMSRVGWKHPRWLRCNWHLWNPAQCEKPANPSMHHAHLRLRRMLERHCN